MLFRSGRRRRQYLGHCEKRDAHRASLSEVSVTFKRVRKPSDRGVAAIPITEKMLMRHAWYRRKKSWDALRASLPEENRLS